MISSIVVIGKNREIGCNNQLLWDLPKDMARFKKTTLSKTVIMGDKTFESIGRPLPGRKNIVLSLAEDYQAPGCEVRNSLEEVMKEYQSVEEEVFVIGGALIYQLSLPYVDKIYLTIIDDQPKADTFFPAYEKDFRKVVKQEEGQDNGFSYRYIELVRK